MEKKILLVEDEPSIREILIFLFEMQGWSVIEAEEGFQGLEQFEIHRPDYILTDINMPQRSNGHPGLGGMEFIESVKKLTHEKMPTIYVMSGYLDNKMKMENLEVVSEYFEKPNLGVAVERICNQYALKEQK